MTASEPHLRINPETAEADMMRLVLTLADFLKETLERQALRRMERGAVDDDQIAAMSEAFERMDRKIEQLCAEAGVKRESLDIALGPFGSLMGRMPPGGSTDAPGDRADREAADATGPKRGHHKTVRV